MSISQSEINQLKSRFESISGKKVMDITRSTKHFDDLKRFIISNSKNRRVIFFLRRPTDPSFYVLYEQIDLNGRGILVFSHQGWSGWFDTSSSDIQIRRFVEGEHLSCVVCFERKMGMWGCNRCFASTCGNCCISIANNTRGIKFEIVGYKESNVKVPCPICREGIINTTMGFIRKKTPEPPELFE